MLKLCGMTRSPLRGPILYFIFTREILYIGETQKHPTKRWCTHLLPNSDFIQRIRLIGDPEIDYLNELLFLAFFCQPVIENFDVGQWKTATQAVEHELHCLVLQKPSILGSFFNLVSDTEKTAPRRFSERVLARKIASDILDSVALELSN